MDNIPRGQILLTVNALSWNLSSSLCPHLCFLSSFHFDLSVALLLFTLFDHVSEYIVFRDWSV